MGDIADYFQQQGIKSVEVAVRENRGISEIKGVKKHDLSELELILSYKSQSGEYCSSGYFLGYIKPEQREMRSKEGEKVNLDYFSDMPIDIERGRELYLLGRLMLFLSRIDPRISGSTTEDPCVRIAKIGKKEFDLDEIKAYYITVSEANHDRLKAEEAVKSIYPYFPMLQEM
jgi:hypothetical protein